MQKLVQVQKFDSLQAFFAMPALSLKNTFFNDFLVCANTTNMMGNYRTLPMIIKGNKFWTDSVKGFINECIL
ncbi:hypothetical protein SCLARK_00771 [Spiroplasma clarkii]|uniref:Uncharacterized protein n=1 Tax=Spiroplasma clarkii TaxID=2139 RepID=A0A1Y0L112_9MOLU|nr:hypothetical protein [Spiroplasma clarkii]ARU91408.1 hypothetical protein SCLARK_00771 [Spiroplasma clarkii]ATX70824.1 hypothetical protein SCLAR_v1c05050 [Spiroplasma clarkii]